jgi:hypothetical protein
MSAFSSFYIQYRGAERLQRHNTRYKKPVSSSFLDKLSKRCICQSLQTKGQCNWERGKVVSYKKKPFHKKVRLSL